jgi:Na+:H+ antiporter, NhaB family
MRPVRRGSLGLAAAASFLGGAPRWYKRALLVALLVNSLLAWLAGPVPAAWALVGEFILTLALALRCHPLAPGGLLAIEALALGLARPDQAWSEIGGALPVLLLVLFMVAAIGLMRDLLLAVFTRLLVAVRSTLLLSLLFLLGAALLSAFLDALTVIAVVIAIAQGLLAQQELAAGEGGVPPAQAAQLQAALRGLVMHAAVGTAVGGVATLVGEPQNLLIGHVMGWDFLAFARHMAPITVLVLAGAVLACVALAAVRAFSYGVDIPADARAALEAQAALRRASRTARARWRLATQAVAAMLLLVALAMHWAEPGLVGLALVVLLAALQGIVHEERIAESLKEAVPFTALLAVFFVVVAVIQAQSLFGPVVHWVLAQSGTQQLVAMYFANGLLSAVSDNVFVASIYIAQLQQAVAAGTVEPAQQAHLALAINAGTNLPSIATPNGQAAFLYLLTSALAPRIGLSYARMCWMALPYLVVLTFAGLWGLTRLAG